MLGRGTVVHVCREIRMGTRARYVLQYVPPRQSYQMLFLLPRSELFFFLNNSPSSTQNVIAVGPRDQLLSAVAAARHGCGRSIGSR